MRRQEFASFEEIKETQWDRLKILLQHAVRTVPYYRQQFTNLGITPDDIRTPEHFAQLPVLSKAILRKHRESLVSEAAHKKTLIPNATGGSTGQPLQLYQDQQYWDWAYASQVFVESWWGIRPGDRTASVWGVDRDLPPSGWKQKLESVICQTRVCNAFALDANGMHRFALMLQDWCPRYITGYASALEVFAKFLSDRPQIVIRPHAIKSTAEVLSDRQRSLIQNVFSCHVYDFYGSREVNNVAAECNPHSGLHVNSLARYVELVDQGGKPVSESIPGRVLLTDLTNYAMPLIRYENEDIAAWCQGPCACRRSFPRLSALLGRKSDFIVLPSGKLIHGEFFTHLFYGLSGVSQFQVVQTTPNMLRVDVVLETGTSGNVLCPVAASIREVLGDKVACEVRVVNEIVRPISGKHRFTVSKVDVPWGAATIEKHSRAAIFGSPTQVQETEDVG